MPHHAQLPLWDDKPDAQKIEALRHMVADLYAYQMADTRKAYLAILQAAIPADEAEAADIAEMQRLIQHHPNIMAQNCEVGHITGSALVVHPASGRVLLHYHKKLGRWLQFGGHGDDETDFAQVALREAREESGLLDLSFIPVADEPAPIDFDIHIIPASKGRPQHLHLDWRYLLQTAAPEAVLPAHGESQVYAWLPLEAALARDDIDPALKRLIGKAHRELQP